MTEELPVGGVVLENKKKADKRIQEAKIKARPGKTLFIVRLLLRLLVNRIVCRSRYFMGCLKILRNV